MAKTPVTKGKTSFGIGDNDSRESETAETVHTAGVWVEEVDSESLTESITHSSVSSPVIGLYALMLGLCLVLHTPAWLILISYKEEMMQMAGENSKSSSLIAYLSYWILEFIPWFANALLSMFLGCLMLILGYAHIYNDERQQAETS